MSTTTKIQLKIQPTQIKNENETKSKNKKKTYRVAENHNRCQARVSTGLQCRKSRKDDGTLCGWHLRYIPYGRYDGPLEGKFLSIPKKRGRKVRNTKEYSLNDLDLDLYIKTQTIVLNNEKYRIDKQGMLYTNDNECHIVGRREGDLIYWYN
jgi:hypothetical protein